MPVEAPEGIVFNLNPDYNGVYYSRENLVDKNRDDVIAVSKTKIETIDLLSEGEIQGLVTGKWTRSGTLGNVGWTTASVTGYEIPDGYSNIEYLKSIYYNEVPILNDRGEFNFQNVNISYSNGTPSGQILQTISPLQTVSRVIGERLYANSINRKTYRILNTECRGIIVAMKVVSMFKNVTVDGGISDSVIGDTDRVEMKYNVSHRPIFSDQSPTEFITSPAGKRKLFGKITATPYMDSVRIDFPSNYSPLDRNFMGWEIQIEKLTPESTSIVEGNILVIDSITELGSNIYTYPYSAMIRSSFDAEYFSNVPERAFDVELLKVKVPGNYNTRLKTYATQGFATSNGGWDGTFATGKSWTDNPAWCFYDLITNDRYGLGRYIDESEIDKWTLYDIGKYCDTLVSNGEGGLEPRFTCNLWITQREEAYKVVNDLASVFRGMTYYANGLIYAVQDAPKEPIFAFTNANVENGDFTYSSTSRKDRHSVAIVRYNDPKNFYKPAIEYVEDFNAVIRYGIREVEMTAFGCTSRGQAIRLGRWALISDNTETETVSFTAGLEVASHLKPGDVFKISDANRKTRRHGGRTVSINNYSSTGSTVVLDSNVYLDSGVNFYLSVLTPSYHYSSSITDLNSNDTSNISRPFIQKFQFSGSRAYNSGDFTIINLPTGFNETGYYISGRNVWTLEVADSDINTYTGVRYFTNYTDDYFRVLNIKEEDIHRYTVVGLQYNKDKYNDVESGLSYTRDVLGVNVAPNPPSTNINFNIQAGSPEVVQYYFMGDDADVNTTAYNVYVKSGSNFVGNALPGNEYLIDILPKQSKQGLFIPSESGNYYFRIYSSNITNGQLSSSYATGYAPIRTERPIRYTTISSLQLLSQTGNARYTSNSVNILRSNDANPLFSWQVGSENYRNNNDVYYRVTVRPTEGDNLSFFPNTGFLYEATGLTENFWTFDLNTNVGLRGGPYRSYQVVVEAHDAQGYTSAGNKIGYQEGGQWNSYIDNFDTIVIYNPRATGIELTNNLPTEYIEGSGYSAIYQIPLTGNFYYTGYSLTSGNGYLFVSKLTGNYTTTQFIGGNGDITISFNSGVVDEDLVGGYLYVSTGRFPKLPAANNTGGWGNAVNKVRFDFNPKTPKVTIPTAAYPFLGTYTAYCSISLYDDIDNILIDRGIDISTGLYISDNALLYTKTTTPKMDAGGVANIYGVKIVGTATALDDPLILDVIGIRSAPIMYTTGDGYTAVLYFGPPITGSPYSGIPNAEGGANQGGCLSSGAIILNEYGVGVPIYKLGVGDRVLSYDIINKSIITGTINDVLRNSYTSYYTINNSLEITYEHPVYINRNNRWFYFPMKEIKTGDLLLKSDLTTERVDTIEFKNEALPTWNFKVSPEHNFFANNYLVHNAPPFKG